MAGHHLAVAAQAKIFRVLNPVLRGWANYFQHVQAEGKDVARSASGGSTRRTRPPCTDSACGALSLLDDHGFVDAFTKEGQAVLLDEAGRLKSAISRLPLFRDGQVDYRPDAKAQGFGQFLLLHYRGLVFC